jgi:hypothetical protein
MFNTSSVDNKEIEIMEHLEQVVETSPLKDSSSV